MKNAIYSAGMAIQSKPSDLLHMMMHNFEKVAVIPLQNPDSKLLAIRRILSYVYTEVSPLSFLFWIAFISWRLLVLTILIKYL